MKRAMILLLALVTVLSACGQNDIKHQPGDTEKESSEETISSEETLATEETLSSENESSSETAGTESSAETSEKELPPLIMPDDSKFFMVAESEFETEYTYYDGLVRMEKDGKTVFSEIVPELEEKCLRYEKRKFAFINGKRHLTHSIKYERRGPEGEFYTDVCEMLSYDQDGKLALKETDHDVPRLTGAAAHSVSVYREEREIEYAYSGNGKLFYVCVREYKKLRGEETAVYDECYYEAAKWNCDYTRYEPDGTVTEECVCTETDSNETVQTVNFYHTDGSFDVRYVSVIEPPIE